MIKTVPGYEGYYEISESGELWSIPRQGSHAQGARERMTPVKRLASDVVVLKKDGSKKCTTIKKLIEFAFGHNDYVRKVETESRDSIAHILETKRKIRKVAHELPISVTKADLRRLRLSDSNRVYEAYKKWKEENAVSKLS